MPQSPTDEDASAILTAKATKALIVRLSLRCAVCGREAHQVSDDLMGVNERTDREKAAAAALYGNGWRVSLDGTTLCPDHAK